MCLFELKNSEKNEYVESLRLISNCQQEVDRHLFCNGTQSENDCVYDCIILEYKIKFLYSKLLLLLFPFIKCGAIASQKMAVWSPLLCTAALFKQSHNICYGMHVIPVMGNWNVYFNIFFFYNMIQPDPFALHSIFIKLT